MSKKLDTASIANELSEGSAFFRPHNPQPPKVESDPTPPPELIPDIHTPKPTPIILSLFRRITRKRGLLNHQRKSPKIFRQT